MPRQSLESKLIDKPKPYRRISPRAGAPAEVATLFREIVGQVDADHFAQSDAPLLESFCEAVLLGREAYQHLATEGLLTPENKTSPWLNLSEKMQRSQVALAARLRLCPQSRFDRLKAGKTARSSKPGIDWSAT